MKNGVVYKFGPYQLDNNTRVLKRKGELIPIKPKEFDTLLYLVSQAGRTVPRGELLAAVWPDTFVEEGNLNYNISQLRKSLGEQAPGIPYIQTVPKHGYRFVGDVSQVSDERSGPALDALRPGGFRWMLGSVALPILAGTVLLAGIFMWHRAAPVAASITQGRLVRLTSYSGLTTTPALSPDGTLVAYASDRGEGNLHIWVQRVGGAGAIRLTSGPADDYAPSFSPDGRKVVFRSEREGGGLYVISALGGEASRVAAWGRRPRFSPDGKWIAYWIGTDAVGVNQTNFPVPGAAKIYIVPSAGGEPQQLRSDFAAASYPIWTPDSNHILFLGNHDPNVMVEPLDNLQPASASVDWWVTPIQAGPAVATKANTAFRALGLASVSQVPEEWTVDKPGVLMSAALADTDNLWRVPISPDDWRVSSVPSRLTFGTTMDVQPSVAAGNRVVFASLTGSTDVWSIPMDPDRAKPSGTLQRLTADAYDHSYPSVSADGAKIAYSSRRSGTRDIWVKDLATGKEVVISNPPASAFGSVFSLDGSRVVYRSIEKQNSVVKIASLADGSSELVSECNANGGWSSDSKSILCVGAAPARISVADLHPLKMTGLMNHPTSALWNPRFSPDDRWVSFNATAPGRSRIFVAPFRRTGLIPESEWIAITDGGWDDKPRWSPDGNTLYFMSERDGFRCIWAQRLDASKHPIDQAIPIFHAHEARRSLLNVQVGALEMSVARDKIIFNMNERAGNVWMMKIGDPK